MFQEEEEKQAGTAEGRRGKGREIGRIEWTVKKKKIVLTDFITHNICIILCILNSNVILHMDKVRKIIQLSFY